MTDDLLIPRLRRTSSVVRALGVAPFMVLLDLADSKPRPRSELVVVHGGYIDTALTKLVGAGLIERVKYYDAPTAADYRLTDAGRTQLEELRQVWQS